MSTKGPPSFAGAPNLFLSPIFSSQVAGRDIGTSKIPTMNSKTPQGFITKKKLAFKVAELVWNFSGEIQEETGCANVTFQNLVKLVRVARASWQPVFYYEVPIPAPRSQQDVPQYSFS
ncbi:hypothetical protein BJ322DRAFT_1108794 [Thelephora terrestris]|uniref:Uncharacterized protein n=1 Tax=Thelephora terrestris TaxID=56493 RepID=A0A9P6HGD0_9AGAM|nr:hypothetical protein BJ322DRAFT_1108794 [Thelephora terrestris]